MRRQLYVMLGCALLWLPFCQGCRSSQEQTSAVDQATASAEGADQLEVDRELMEALDQAWTLRDQLEAWDEMQGCEFDDGSWAPTEYAPHLWRRLNAMLLELDLRSRGGEAFDKQDLLTQTKEHASDLRELTQTSFQPGMAWSQLPELGKAAQAFHREENQALSSFQRPGLEEAGKYLRYFFRLLYRVPDYIRWHDQISQLDGQNIVRFQTELKRMLEVLAGYRETLAGFDNHQASVALANELAEKIRLLERSRIFLEDLIELEIKFAVDNAGRPKHQLRVERILASPLCSHEQRANLKESAQLTSGQQTGEPLIDKLSNVKKLDELLPTSLSLPPQQESRLRRQLELQRAFLEVVDPDFPGDELSLAENAAFLVSLRKAGEWLRKQHESLPQRILSESEQEPFRAELLLRLVDPRDARAIQDQLAGTWVFPQLRLRPPIRELQAIQHQPTGPIRLSRDEWRRITLRIIMPTIDSTITPPAHSDSDGLEIRLVDTRRDKKKGEQFRTYEVRATRERTESDGRNALRFSVTSQTDADNVDDHQETTLVVDYQLPRPQEIQLIVRRVSPERQENSRIGDAQSVFLRPFPNRTTEFRCWLKNLSDDQQEVDVRLLAMNRPGGAFVKRGRLLDTDGKPYPGFQPRNEDVVARADALVLPPNAERLIQFGSESDDQPAEDGGATESDESDAVVDELPAGTDITDGMKCVIESRIRSGLVWEKWIEIEPLRPREYLQVKSSYSPADETIRVKVQAQDDDGDGIPDPDKVLPPNLTGQPDVPESFLVVDWGKTQDELTSSAAGSFQKPISRASPAIELRAAVPRQRSRQYVTIPLTVDGCPRAFVHRVFVHQANKGRDFRDDHGYCQNSIRINSLQTADLGYRTSTDVAIPDLEANQIRDLLGDRDFATFKAVRRKAEMRVGFQVDAPTEAFGGTGPRDVIRWQWARGRSENVFYSDRQVNVRCQEARSDGSLLISTALRDHQVQLPIAGISGPADISIDGQFADSKYSRERLTVVLDDDPPQIVDFRVNPTTVTQGQDITVELTVKDVSGIAEAKLGFTEGEKDALPEKPEVVSDPAMTDNLTSISKRMKTSKLEPGDYWLQASVTDRIDNTEVAGSDRPVFKPQRVSIKAAAVAAAVKAAKVAGTVKGTVLKGTFKAPRIVVEIKGLRPVQTDLDGRFAIPNVPADKYEIKASGRVLNGPILNGEIAVEFKKLEDYQEEFTIQLE